MVGSEKNGWAEEHARKMESRFQEWQQPLGISGDDYLRYLTEELAERYDDPLWKSLIESMS